MDRPNTLVIHGDDDVAVALVPLRRGDRAEYRLGGSLQQVEAAQDIPVYHKIALRDMKKGELVRKYGATIGKATRDIKQGEHVHRHNLVSESLYVEEE